MKKFFEEFKAFAFKGNVLQLAIAVIIGGAFSGIVSSLTENILSPLIGLITGQNFDTLSVEFLGVTLSYGAFITAVINFLILAFTIFVMMKLVNKAIPKKAEAPKAPTTKQCPYCLTEIPIPATRCPACTSMLETKEAQ